MRVVLLSHHCIQCYINDVANWVAPSCSAVTSAMPKKKWYTVCLITRQRLAHRRFAVHPARVIMSLTVALS